jgi:hypothetical protein
MDFNCTLYLRSFLQEEPGRIKIRLVERESLGRGNTNCMEIEEGDTGKIFVAEEMKRLDLLLQLSLQRGAESLGSISASLNEVLEKAREGSFLQ